MERDQGASADAVAERVSAMARGDVFGQAGRESDRARCAGVLLGIKMGAAELSFVDQPGAEGGAAEALIGSWFSLAWIVDGVKNRQQLRLPHEWILIIGGAPSVLRSG